LINKQCDYDNDDYDDDDDEYYYYYIQQEIANSKMYVMRLKCATYRRLSTSKTRSGISSAGSRCRPAKNAVVKHHKWQMTVRYQHRLERVPLQQKSTDKTKVVGGVAQWSERRSSAGGLSLIHARDLWLTSDHSVGKVSDMGHAIRPTQPSTYGTCVFRYSDPAVWHSFKPNISDTHRHLLMF